MFNARKDWNVGIFPLITMASGNSMLGSSAHFLTSILENEDA